jgi:hypothetical protein
MKRGGAEDAEERHAVDLCDLCASAFQSHLGMNGKQQKVPALRAYPAMQPKKGPAVPRVRAWTCPRSNAMPVRVIGFESNIISSVFGIPRESQVMQTEPAGIPLPRVRATLRVLDR